MLLLYTVLTDEENIRAHPNYWSNTSVEGGFWDAFQITLSGLFMAFKRNRGPWTWGSTSADEHGDTLLPKTSDSKLYCLLFTLHDILTIKNQVHDSSKSWDNGVMELSQTKKKTDSWSLIFTHIKWTNATICPLFFKQLQIIRNQIVMYKFWLPLRK